LVVKVPLKGDRCYLVENRQPFGYDRILPDPGLLILKADPNAPEGYGTAKIMDADPKSPRFSRATFRLDRPNRNLCLDQGANVAIILLWTEGEDRGVLVTVKEKSDHALNPPDDSKADRSLYGSQGIRRAPNHRRMHRLF
jgi:hypothetical protein